MKWQKKHDIILNWIDSCQTFDQLTNMIYYVKKQDFDTDKLLWFAKLKAGAIYGGKLVEALNKLV